MSVDKGMTEVRARLLRELEARGAEDEQFARDSSRRAAQRQQDAEEDISSRQEEQESKRRRISCGR